MQGLAIRTALVLAATVAFAAPAAAQEPQPDTRIDFTLGRVLNTVPDKLNRIGIRSACTESRGCKVDFNLMRGTVSLGGNQVQLIGNTTETDYIVLSKRTAASLRKRRMRVTVIAVVRDPAGNEMTYTKVVTLGPKRR